MYSYSSHQTQYIMLIIVIRIAEGKSTTWILTCCNQGCWIIACDQGYLSSVNSETNIGVTRVLWTSAKGGLSGLIGIIKRTVSLRIRSWKAFITVLSYLRSYASRGSRARAFGCSKQCSRGKFAFSDRLPCGWTHPELAGLKKHQI